jgi:hypothetical protein
METEAPEGKTFNKSYDWLKPHQFKAGNPGGPGRPKGPTLKTWVKNHFESMSDEERAEFLNKIEPIKAWEMGEGKPDTKSTVDATIEHKLDPELQKTINNALDEII